MLLLFTSKKEIDKYAPAILVIRNRDEKLEWAGGAQGLNYALNASNKLLSCTLVSVDHGWILLGSGKWRVRLGPNIFSFPLFLFSFCL